LASILYNAAGMSSPFIDFDDYRRLYPEYCKRDQSDGPAPKPEVTFDKDKTPVMLVQEASCKNSVKYIGEVFFEEKEELDPKTGIAVYICNARLMKFSGTGNGRSKKSAKQKACFELLKCAVEMDRYQDFRIPAKSKEEARKILEQIKPADDDISINKESKEVSVPENWTGKLMDICLQNKLPVPAYEDEEAGPPNNRIYTVYSIVGDSKASGSGKKKKEAKNEASKNLYQLLQSQVDSLRKATNQLEGNSEDMGDDEENEPIEGLLGAAGVDVSRAGTETEPQKALEGILSDTTRFLPNYVIHYRELSQPSTRGRSQSLLTVQYSKAPPQPIVHPDGSVTTPKVDKDAPASFNYVFCGEGMDAGSARDEAARSALVHFLTYKGPRETPTPAPIPLDP
ncbi:hypothetical protein PENTCL1PPCAC_11807, partial [Pristionchus entomophagus]